MTRSLGCRVLCRVAALGLALAWCCGSLPALGAPVGETVVLPSRVNLVPWVLDAVRRILERGLNRTIALSVRPAAGFSADEPGLERSWLLLEDGDPPPVGREATGLRLSLHWVLGVRADLLAPVASAGPTTLSEFREILVRLRARPAPVFPWFESLYSPMTLRCFEVAWATGVPEQGFTALPFLQHALDQKLLNPFSIDADEALAFDVFEAGDTVFATMWVPGEALPVGSLLRGTLTRALFMPLPGPQGPAPVPRLDFTLWTPVGRAAPVLAPGVITASAPFVARPLEARLDERWIRFAFPEAYDRLVRGGGD